MGTRVTANRLPSGPLGRGGRAAGESHGFLQPHTSHASVGVRYRLCRLTVGIEFIGGRAHRSGPLVVWAPIGAGRNSRARIGLPSASILNHRAPGSSRFHASPAVDCRCWRVSTSRTQIVADGKFLHHRRWHPRISGFGVAGLGLASGLSSAMPRASGDHLHDHRLAPALRGSAGQNEPARTARLASIRPAGSA